MENNNDKSRFITKRNFGFTFSTSLSWGGGWERKQGGNKFVSWTFLIIHSANLNFSRTLYFGPSFVSSDFIKRNSPTSNSLLLKLKFFIPSASFFLLNAF